MVGARFCERRPRAFFSVDIEMAVEVTVLTLAFDPLLEGFPNERLRDFLVGRELLSVDSFSFVQGGVPYWSLCITYRRLRGQDEPKNDDPKETVTPDAKARKDAFRDLLSELDERERVAYDRLRGWRRETAHEQGLAPYMICNDRALLELVRRRPRTKAGLLEVKGIGEKKVHRSCRHPRRASGPVPRAVRPVLPRQDAPGARRGRERLRVRQRSFHGSQGAVPAGSDGTDQGRPDPTPDTRPLGHEPSRHCPKDLR